MITLPNLQDAPQFDAQAVPDSGDEASLVAGIGGTGIISGGVVSAQGTPNRTVAVSAIDGVINRVPFHAASVASLSIPSYTTDVKHAVVYDSADLTIKIVAGTACGTVGWSRSVTDKIANPPPVKPVLASTQVLLFEIYDDGNNVTTGHLKDKRTPVNISSGEIMVAATDSIQLVRFAANYVCDGVSDEVEINAAVTLASTSPGGKVTLAAGTFTLSNSIQMKYNNVKVEGHGKGTIISANYALQTVAGPITNCTVTNASNQVTLSSATGVFLGQLISDSGGFIPAGTVVENIVGTTLTLSKPATGSSTTDALTFKCYGIFPIFDVYDQSSSGSTPIDDCTIKDMLLTTSAPNTVAAVTITGLPGGTRGSAARTLACGVYLSGSNHTVRDLKITNLQVGVVTDIWNRASTIQTTATDGIVTINVNTVTSATLAPIAQVGDTLTVSGQTGGMSSKVVGYITEINHSTNVITVDVTMLTTVASGGTVVLTPSAYGLGRAARNWIQNLDCYNLWAGAVGNWTEQNHIEGVKGLFVESVMADNVGSTVTYGSVSPSVALYYDGANGNNHLSLDISDIEMTDAFYSGSSPSGTSVSGSTITGTGFTSAMSGWFVFTEGAGTGVIPPYATVTYVNSTTLTLSQPATTNGTILTLVLSKGDYRGHTIKMNGQLRANVTRVRSYGNPLLVVSNASRYVQWSEMSCLSGLSLILQLPDPQASGGLNTFIRECSFNNIHIDYDQSSQGGNTTVLTGVNNVFKNFVITTNWSSTSTNAPLYISGQNNTIDGLLVNHRGEAAPGLQFISNLGGNTARNIRGINVNNLLQSNSGNNAANPNRVCYDPAETVLSASPSTPFATHYVANASVIPWIYDILPTQKTVSQNGGGTKTPDFTACTTYVIDVTDGTAFTIGQAYPRPVLTSNLLPAGMRIRFMVKNTSGGALGVITWDTSYVFTTLWANPSNGHYSSVEFESDGTNWIQVASAGILDSALLTSPYTEKSAAGYTTANLGWTFDPMLGQNSWQPGNGFVYFTRVKCLVGGLCGHLAYLITTAGVSLTSGQCFIGLYDTGQITPGTATLIGASSDQSGVWTTIGEYATVITAQGGNSLSLVAGQDYFVAVLDNGTTAPKFLVGINGSSFGSGAGTFVNLNKNGSLAHRVCEYTTGGQTTLPSSVGNGSMGVGGLAAVAAICTT